MTGDVAICCSARRVYRPKPPARCKFLPSGIGWHHQADQRAHSSPEHVEFLSSRRPIIGGGEHPIQNAAWVRLRRRACGGVLATIRAPSTLRGAAKGWIQAAASAIVETKLLGDWVQRWSHGEETGKKQSPVSEVFGKFDAQAPKIEMASVIGAVPGRRMGDDPGAALGGEALAAPAHRRAGVDRLEKPAAASRSPSRPSQNRRRISSPASIPRPEKPVAPVSVTMRNPRKVRLCYCEKGRAPPALPQSMWRPLAEELARPVEASVTDGARWKSRSRKGFRRRLVGMGASSDTEEPARSRPRSRC